MIYAISRPAYQQTPGRKLAEPDTLAFAKKIAQETGRALADVARRSVLARFRSWRS